MNLTKQPRRSSITLAIPSISSPKKNSTSNRSLTKELQDEYQEIIDRFNGRSDLGIYSKSLRQISSAEDLSEKRTDRTDRTDYNNDILDQTLKVLENIPIGQKNSLITKYLSQNSSLEQKHREQKRRLSIDETIDNLNISVLNKIHNDHNKKEIAIKNLNFKDLTTKICQMSLTD